MVGITGYGVHIPWNRLDRRLIFGALGWFNAANAAYTRGEKAVASYDEDSLTMAVTAGLNCLGERERGKTAGLFLATTTPPYKERSVAAIAATALNLPAGVRSVDFNGSLKAGTGALLAGCEAVAENGGEVLVCAADCRLGKAGSAQEYLFGDCAVAFSVGKEDVAATFEGFYSTTHDFVDHRRLEGDLFDRTWEERWIREEGYAKLIPEVIAGLLQKYDLQIGDFAKLIFPCPFDRVQVAVAGKLGATRDQVSPALMAEVGDTGTAQPLLMLAAALEDAAPGDRLLVAGFGNGCDALIFRVTEEIKKIKGLSGFKAGLARKRQLASYEKYAGFRHLLDLETGIRGEQVAFTSFPVLWRERKSVLALCGVQCRRCGTPQFPYQRVCVNPRCGAVDEMDEYCFAGKKGSIFTYTADHLAFSPEPPAVYGIVDFAGGGRYWFDFTDFNLAGLQVGMPVALNFRRKYADLARGVYGYFWKAVPVLEQGVDLNG